MIGEAILLDPWMERIESFDEEEVGSSLGGALLRLGGSFEGGGAIRSEGGFSPGGCGCPAGIPADTERGGGGRLERETVATRGLLLFSLEGGAEGGGPLGMGTTLMSAWSDRAGVAGLEIWFGLSSSGCSNMVIPPALTAEETTAGELDFGCDSLLSLSGLLVD